MRYGRSSCLALALLAPSLLGKALHADDSYARRMYAATLESCYSPPCRVGGLLGVTIPESDRDTYWDLLRAHENQEPAPFRAALASRTPWRVLVALEGLPAARTAAWGNPIRPEIPDASRRVDFEFVSSFLPDLERFSRDRTRWMNDTTYGHLAIAALGTLAVRGLDPQVRTRAMKALLDSVPMGMPSRPHNSFGFCARSLRWGSPSSTTSPCRLSFCRWLESVTP
jgi:hypothetical protein